MTPISLDESIELKELEDKLDQLISKYHTIKNENILLKRQQQCLLEEKALLLEKTTLAKSRVESMITRLKTMEQNS